MVSKSTIKFINSLQQKKFRNEHNMFVAEGVKIVEELILSNAFTLQHIIATDTWVNNNEALAIRHSAILNVATEKDLQQASSLTTANEVLVVAAIPKVKLNRATISESLSLVLDEVKDPGNMGTIIRIADWFGIDTIVCSENCVDIYNPKVVQATMGSVFRIKVHYTDIKAFIEEMKTSYKLPVYGALLEGENIYKQTLSSKGLILMGNESKGISKEIQELVTNRISIPSFSSANGAESLNVAVATSIICSEFRRRA